MQGSVRTLTLNVTGCHPGYKLNTTSQLCECYTSNIRDALRCDGNNRYIFLRVSGGRSQIQSDTGSLVVCVDYNAPHAVSTEY